ncbi:MAG: hypothetical protein HGA22_14450 [Clostridiales bacterium]|nr:hypothetical protein [Clostridiales bacterium]
MEGFELGAVSGIDSRMDFTCGSEDGNIVRNYKNAPGGTAFKRGEKYTWNGYLRAPESGEYRLVLQVIGGIGAFKISLDGETYTTIGQNNIREGDQWPWNEIICTEGGLDIYWKKVSLEAAKIYKVKFIGCAKLENKDLQIRAAWVTPSGRKADMDRAIELAGKNDMSVVFVWANSNSEKGPFDPDPTAEDFKAGKFSLLSLGLDNEQSEFAGNVLREAKKHGKQTAVVINAGRVITDTGWMENADAILHMWLPGQEGGTATARLLLGQVNPSGKSVVSFPATDRDTFATDTPEHTIERREGIADETGRKVVTYSEGIFFGYRWHDRENKAAMFPFGHGLSYTSFEYSDLNIEKLPDGALVSLNVSNTGSVPGDEIIQVYAGQAKVPSGVQAAVKKLCGFERVENLQPGETRRVQVMISNRNLSYWNPFIELQQREDGTLDKWVPDIIGREILAGSSSADIRLKGIVEG